MKKKSKYLSRAQELYGHCIFGGNPEQIKKLVAENDYTIKELEYAVQVLIDNVTSALENNMANDSVTFLSEIINGKKLLQKIKS